MITYIRAADGQTVSRDEACNGSVVKPGYSVRSTTVRDGEHVTFSMAFLDSAPATMLRDAAGKPVTLCDRSSGATMRLTDDHVAIIHAEATKAGMSVPAYVSDVLRFSVA